MSNEVIPITPECPPIPHPKIHSKKLIKATLERKELDTIIVRQRCQELSNQAVDVIKEIMENKDELAKDRLSAARTILSFAIPQIMPVHADMFESEERIITVNY